MPSMLTASKSLLKKRRVVSKFHGECVLEILDHNRNFPPHSKFLTTSSSTSFTFRSQIRHAEDGTASASSKSTYFLVNPFLYSNFPLTRRTIQQLFPLGHIRWTGDLERSIDQLKERQEYFSPKARPIRRLASFAHAHILTVSFLPGGSSDLCTPSRSFRQHQTLLFPAVNSITFTPAATETASRMLVPGDRCDGNPFFDGLALACDSRHICAYEGRFEPWRLRWLVQQRTNLGDWISGYIRTGGIGQSSATADVGTARDIHLPRHCLLRTNARPRLFERPTLQSLDRTRSFRLDYQAYLPRRLSKLYSSKPGRFSWSEPLLPDTAIRECIHDLQLPIDNHLPTKTPLPHTTIRFVNASGHLDMDCYDECESGTGEHGIDARVHHALDMMIREKIEDPRPVGEKSADDLWGRVRFMTREQAKGVPCDACGRIVPLIPLSQAVSADIFSNEVVIRAGPLSPALTRRHPPSIKPRWR